MARDNFVQITGSLGQDPELRYTTGGHAVVSFSVAWSDRKKDPDSGNWVDGETSWFRCTAWRDMAENIAASLTKGSRVVVTGSIKIREWQDNEGNKRWSTEIDVDEVGPSLRWAQAQIDRTVRDKPESSANRPAGGGRSEPIYGDEEPF